MFVEENTLPDVATINTCGDSDSEECVALWADRTGVPITSTTNKIIQKSFDDPTYNPEIDVTVFYNCFNFKITKSMCFQ